MTERVIDMMILLFLTLIVVITQFKQVGIFLDNNQEIEEKVVNMFHSSWMLLVLVVLNVCFVALPVFGLLLHFLIVSFFFI